MAEATTAAKKRKQCTVTDDEFFRAEIRALKKICAADETNTTQTPKFMQSSARWPIEDWNKAADEKKKMQTPQPLQLVHEASMAPYAASELAHFSHERLIQYITDLQTEQTSQSVQAVYGLSMAPYTARELTHFSHERLVGYITNLQEQVRTVKTETKVEEVVMAKTEALVEAGPKLSETSRNPTEKATGLPFFGDANPCIDLQRGESFHLEVMQTRAAMKQNMLEQFRRESRGSASTAFAIEVPCKRVIEELFGHLLSWEIGSAGRKIKSVFVYDLDVSPKVRFGIRSLRSSMLIFFQTYTAQISKNHLDQVKLDIKGEANLIWDPATGRLTCSGWYEPSSKSDTPC